MTTWEETYYTALDSAAIAFTLDEEADQTLLTNTINDYETLLAYTLDSASLAFALDEEADQTLLTNTINDYETLLALHFRFGFISFCIR